MIRLPIEAPSRRYEVWVGRGLALRLGELLAEAGVRGRIALVVDEHVFSLWGERVVASLPPHRVWTIPQGEASKNLAQAERLWTALAEAGFSRDDCVVALGGGVVGDLAGFVAATYHRGMRFVQVPTTLLAQVDSSVGGKVAIDLPLGKNLVGAFHQPELVVADTELLDTLDPRERWAGLAEVVKAALIRDEAFLEMLEAQLPALAAGDEALDEVIARAIRIKAEVVARDERESGLRQILNFGHTIGHAIEAACAYEGPKHGEAVALGMVGSVWLSLRLGLLGREEAERAFAVLERFPEVDVPADAEAIFEALRRDKKVRDGALRFVLIGPIGNCAIREVEEGLVREAIDVVLRRGVA